MDNKKGGLLAHPQVNPVIAAIVSVSVYKSRAFSHF
jgi:hypothetical protein